MLVIHDIIIQIITRKTIKGQQVKMPRLTLDSIINKLRMLIATLLNPLTPNNHYRGRTAMLTSECCILYIYSTNTGTEYFKHGIYSSFFSLQNAV